MTFNPHWVSAPGTTISDIMESNNVTHRELCDKLGLEAAEFYLLLLGDLEINDDLAEKLSKWAGSSKAFWLAREANYREGLAKGYKKINQEDLGL